MRFYRKVRCGRIAQLLIFNENKRYDVKSSTQHVNTLQCSQSHLHLMAFSKLKGPKVRSSPG